MAIECSRFLELASEYIDETLAGDDTVACDRHLDGCTSCASYIRTLREGLRLLKSSPDPSISDGFHPRLRHRLMHEADGLPLAHPALNSGSSAVALVAMAALLAAIAWAPVLGSRDKIRNSPPEMAIRAATPMGREAGGIANMPLFQTVTNTNRRLGLPDRPSNQGAIWADSRELLFELAPISDRYRHRASTPLGFE